MSCKPQVKNNYKRQTNPDLSIQTQKDNSAGLIIRKEPLIDNSCENPIKYLLHPFWLKKQSSMTHKEIETKA